MDFTTKKRRAPRISQDLRGALRFFVIILACCWLWACADKPPGAASEPAAALAPGLSQSVEPVRSETVNRIFTRTCSGCHGPDGHGIAAVAPDLRRAKARNFAQWQQYLGQTGGHPGAQMPPPTWLNVDEIDVMANYLVTLTQPNTTPTPASAAR
jgi:mono/diheme cytochrome c family protein